MNIWMLATVVGSEWLKWILSQKFMHYFFTMPKNIAAIIHGKEKLTINYRKTKKEQPPKKKKKFGSFYENGEHVKQKTEFTKLAFSALPF